MTAQPTQEGSTAAIAPKAGQLPEECHFVVNPLRKVVETIEEDLTRATASSFVWWL